MKKQIALGSLVLLTAGASATAIVFATKESNQQTQLNRQLNKDVDIDIADLKRMPAVASIAEIKAIILQRINDVFRDIINANPTEQKLIDIRNQFMKVKGELEVNLAVPGLNRNDISSYVAGAALDLIRLYKEYLNGNEDVKVAAAPVDSTIAKVKEKLTEFLRNKYAHILSMDADALIAKGEEFKAGRVKAFNDYFTKVLSSISSRDNLYDIYYNITQTTTARMVPFVAKQIDTLVDWESRGVAFKLEDLNFPNSDSWVPLSEFKQIYNVIYKTKFENILKGVSSLKRGEDTGIKLADPNRKLRGLKDGFRNAYKKLMKQWRHAKTREELLEFVHSIEQQNHPLVEKANKLFSTYQKYLKMQEYLTTISSEIDATAINDNTRAAVVRFGNTIYNFRGEKLYEIPALPKDSGLNQRIAFVHYKGAKTVSYWVTVGDEYLSMKKQIKVAFGNEGKNMSDKEYLRVKIASTTGAFSKVFTEELKDDNKNYSSELLEKFERYNQWRKDVFWSLHKAKSPYQIDRLMSNDAFFKEKLQLRDSLREAKKAVPTVIV